MPSVFVVGGCQLSVALSSCAEPGRHIDTVTNSHAIELSAIDAKRARRVGGTARFGEDELNVELAVRTDIFAQRQGVTVMIVVGVHGCGVQETTTVGAAVGSAGSRD